MTSDPDALWDALKQITQAAERESSPRPPAIYVANTFALIAVLLTKCREWLRAHPDAEKFCRGSVLAVAPSTEPPDVNQQLPSGDSDPQVFYAAGLAALWAESPRSGEVRFLVAHLASTGTDVGVAALCQHAFRRRAALGGGFFQLQSLVVYSAGERSRHTYAAGLRDSPERFVDWLSREAAAFAAGHNRGMPADWSRIRHRHFSLPQSNWTPYSRTTERQHPGVDFEYLVAAFSWIPPLEAGRLAGRASALDRDACPTLGNLSGDVPSSPRSGRSL